MPRHTLFDESTVARRTFVSPVQRSQASPASTDVPRETEPVIAHQQCKAAIPEAGATWDQPGRALRSAGVVFGPSFILGEALAQGSLVRVLPEYSAADFGIHTVVPSSRYLSTKVRNLIDRLVTEFGENPP